MGINGSHRGLLRACAILWPVHCVILAVVLVFSVQPAHTQGSVAGPTLMLDRSAYCIGESWKLNIVNAPAGAAIRLAGVLNGNPWSLPDWGITDQDGRYIASGTYIDGNQGTYQLYAEIGGITSNMVFVSVSDCEQGQPQGFAFTGSMGTPRSGHTTTLLADGRVLVVGGGDDSAELFDPATETFSPTGSPITRRSGHAAVLLSDGKVLIAGGYSQEGGNLTMLDSAELYDPSIGTFSQTGNMTHFHVKPTATLLANGEILLAGGLDSWGVGGHAGAGAELFDPTTGVFTTVGSMISARADHMATLLRSGDVLVVGGWNGNAPDAADDPPFDPLFAESFDAASGNFRAAGEMNSSLSGHTATLLPNGKVAVIGGFTWPQDPSATIKIYDPSSQTFSSSGNVVEPRTGHTATLLDNGRVLIAGGEDPYTTVISNGNPVLHMLSSAGLYDPASGSLTAIPGLLTARWMHTATLLKSGAVLMIGGADSSGAALATAEMYKNAAGPTLTLDSSAYCIGESWKLNIVNAPAGAAIRLAGVLNGNPWSLPDWGVTDQDGRYIASGTYIDGNQGTYQLYAEIGGITSNTVSVSVSAGCGDWDY